jgi:hypothetical protein
MRIELHFNAATWKKPTKGIGYLLSIETVSSTQIWHSTYLMMLQAAMNNQVFFQSYLTAAFPRIMWKLNEPLLAAYLLLSRKVELGSVTATSSMVRHLQEMVTMAVSVALGLSICLGQVADGISVLLAVSTLDRHHDLLRSFHYNFMTTTTTRAPSIPLYQERGVASQ